GAPRAAQIDNRPAQRISRSVSLFRSHVSMDRQIFAVQHAAEASPSVERPQRLAYELGKRWRHTTQGWNLKTAALVDQKHTKSGPAHLHRLFQDRVEYRGEIAGRRIDDLQYLGGRGLLLQGLARLGQEPRVFHRDDRLRGEIL